MNSNDYLHSMIQKYQAKNIIDYSNDIVILKNKLQIWADGCYLNIIDSGSRAKGTAISLGSDVDFMISLRTNCNENSGGLESIYESLFCTLNSSYSNVRKQNVSIRITLADINLRSHGLEIDITPARKQSGNTNDHSLWVSKLSTWKQTNIQKHIKDVSQSGRTNEIKLLKIWRELNKLDFPSIYLEYLLINNILRCKPCGLDSLTNNFWHVLSELSKINGNPLFLTVIDPANSKNILSDQLTRSEKDRIFLAAKNSKKNWNEIIW